MSLSTIYALIFKIFFKSRFSPFSAAFLCGFDIEEITSVATICLPLS